MTTTAKRLAAAGVEIIGADGEPRLIRFDFAALARVEEHLGSLGAATDALIALIDSRANSFATPIMGHMRGLLDAAMRPRVCDDVLDEVDGVPIGTLIDALYDAWLQAWPPKTDEGKPEAPPTKRSRGRSSTGGQRSDSAATTKRSGG